MQEAAGFGEGRDTVVVVFFNFVCLRGDTKRMFP